MFQKIEMALCNGETKEIEFLANAATPLRYKMTFRQDLLTKFANAKTEVDGVENYNIDFLSELAFIMAMQAEANSNEKLKLDKLNFNSFLDWLESFDSMAFENKASELIDVYLGNVHTDSEAKKNIDQQTESSTQQS